MLVLSLWRLRRVLFAYLGYKSFALPFNVFRRPIVLLKRFLWYVRSF